MFFTGSIALAQPIISTAIDSEVPAYAIPGHRITIGAVITDSEGVMEARCYFRTDSSNETLYVPMEHRTDNRYRCTLPALSAHIDRLNYFFLVVNGKRQVIRSTELQVDSDPSETISTWQKETNGDQPLQVFGELKPPDLDASGVADENAIAVLADPASRHGLLVDAYTPDEIPAEWNAAHGYFGGFILESKDHPPRPVKGFGVGLGTGSGLKE